MSCCTPVECKSQSLCTPTDTNAVIIPKKAKPQPLESAVERKMKMSHLDDSLCHTSACNPSHIRYASWLQVELISHTFDI